MKLEEVFAKYPDEQDGFYRQKKVDELIKHRPDLTETEIIEAILRHSVGWLKGLKGWGNEESRKLGFIIPSCMIEDANADDWKLFEENK